MPKKTIYVRDEDMPDFEKALKKLGGEEGIGTIIVEALRKSIRDHKEEEEKVFRLSVLANCPLPSLFAECVEFRLQSLPADIVSKVHYYALAAYKEDPDYFINCGFVEIDDHTWWEGVRERAERGKLKADQQIKAVLERTARQMQGEMKLPERGHSLSDKEVERFVEVFRSELQGLDKSTKGE